MVCGVVGGEDAETGCGLYVKYKSLFTGSGYYVPRAYFTIDENGQQSPIYNVDPLLVHRVRRSPQFASTSSSTSTSTSSGNVPLFFNPRKLTELS